MKENIQSDANKGSASCGRGPDGGTISIQISGLSFALRLIEDSDGRIKVGRFPNAVVKVLTFPGSLPGRLVGWDDYTDVWEPVAISEGDKVFVKHGSGNSILGVRMVKIITDATSLTLDYTCRLYPLEALSMEKAVGQYGEIKFKTRARLLSQLGEQLIKDEGVALLELIKNSYDADATYCKVVMTSPTDVKHGEICIFDDGHGMDLETINHAWLEIGTDSKAANQGVHERTGKFGRIPLGEKGIGRFGVHRLGQVVDVVTKSAKNNKEIHLEIDWRLIADSDYVENFPLKCWERDPEIFKNGETGTRIIVSGFRQPWSKRSLLSAARAVSALNSPFEDMSAFHTSFMVECDELAEGWVSQVLKYSDIKDSALFSFDITMRGQYIVRYHYKFTPWPTMDRVVRREVQWGRESPLSRMVLPRKGLELWDSFTDDAFNDDWSIDVDDMGEVRFSGVIFDLDAKVLSLGLQDTKGLKQYLKENAGVRVFRDNMRVLDYGEPGNDWLGLNDRKFRRATSHIANSVVLGAVYLNRESSDVLVEKANREGFIDNGAYQRLRAAINFCLDRIDSDWETDKNVLRKMYSSKGGADSIPVETPVTELRSILKEIRTLTDVERSNIDRKINQIESDFALVVNNLIKSAGAGLNLIMVLHQMEKIVRALGRAVKRNVDAAALENQLGMLDDLIKGYSIMVKSSERKSRDLSPIVSQAIFNTQFRFEAHHITVETPFRERGSTFAICSEGHVLNAILNIFDNSIWWMGYAKIEEASLYVDISTKKEGRTVVVIADNGPGFTKPTTEIIRPFVTDKPGGMGIGLHLTDEIMKTLGGSLEFPRPEEYDVPEKFSRGAIVALSFLKGDAK